MESLRQLRNNHQIIFAVALLFSAFYSGCATTVPQSSSDPSAYDPNVFFEVEVSSREVSPDEAIYLKYALFTRYDTRYEGFQKEDILDGFWIARPKQSTEVDRTILTRNGKKYVRAVVHRKQIFAASAGAKTIMPPRIRITYTTQNTNSIFADLQSAATSRNEKILQVEPVVIQVKEFPEEGKPAQFSGSMGQYDMDAWIRQKENIEDEFDLNLVIEGKGNVWGIRLPSLPVGEDFKILDVREKVSANVPWDEGGAVTGSKNFAIRLAPKHQGDLVIPSIKFSYFDQETKAYRTIQTEPIEIRVNKVDSNILNQPDPQSGLVVLLDRSGSMQALDFAFANRFKIAQNIATEIVSNVDSEWFGAKTFAASVNDLADKSLSEKILRPRLKTLKLRMKVKTAQRLGGQSLMLSQN